MQTCVGLGPARCHILTLRKLNILLDCGLWDACGQVTPTGTPACLTPILQVEFTPRLCCSFVSASWGGSAHLIMHRCTSCCTQAKTHHARVGLSLFCCNVPAAKPICTVRVPVQLLSLYELHGALIATPHGALALPMLLAAHPGLLHGRAYATLGTLDAAHHLAADLVHSMAPPPPQQQPCAPPADNGATQAPGGDSQPPAVTQAHPVPVDAAHQVVGAPSLVTAGAPPLDGLAGGLPPVLGLHPLPGQQAQVVAHGCWRQALPAEGWRAGLRRVRVGGRPHVHKCMHACGAAEGDPHQHAVCGCCCMDFAGGGRRSGLVCAPVCPP